MSAALTREQREELKSLSREVFGVASRYQKYLDGITVPVMTEVEEEVPGEDGAEPTKRMVSVPKTVNGVKVYQTKVHTYEQTKEILLGYKAMRDKYMEEQRKAQEEAKAKQAQLDLQNKVNEVSSGSAI